MIGPYYVGDRPRDTIAISVLRDGNLYDLSGYTSAAITLEGPSGAAVDVTGVSVTLDTGDVFVTWPLASSLFTVAGIYTMQVLLLTGSGTVDHADTLTFEVRPSPDIPATGWATLSDVAAFTGIQATPGQLTQAQALIEMFASITYADTVDPTFIALSARDARHLKMAVAYQAAFVVQNEAIYSRAAVLSMSQDGISVTTSQRSGGGVDETALTVAPLAKMALRMLSWKSPTKTTRVRPSRHGQYPYLEDYANAWMRDEDDSQDWQPMPGVGGSL